MMGALQGAEVAAAAISEATGHLKTVPDWATVREVSGGAACRQCPRSWMS